MTSRQRVALAAAAVTVVLLFVAAVGNQRRAAEGDPAGDRGGLVGLLGDWRGDAAGVDPRDLSASCRQPDGRLEFGGSCTVEVAEGDPALRLVLLRAADPVAVTAPAPVGDFTISAELEAGETTRVAVDDSGADIRLRCRADADCVVRVGERDG